MEVLNHNPLNVHLDRITAENVLQVCRLTGTLSPAQRMAVTENAVSIAQGHCSDQAWMRAIYAEEELVGFLMLHIGSNWADGIDCPGVYLWRLMIAGPHQGKGCGASAMRILFAHCRSLGVPEIYTSYHLGEGSPEDFYRKLGFVPTGDHYRDEPEVVLRFDNINRY